jgi:fructokinase
VAASPLLAIVDRLEPPHYFFVGDGAADLAFDPAALPEGWQAGLAWAHFGGISLVREPLGGRLEALALELKAQGVQLSFDPNHRALMSERDLPRLLRLISLADAIKVSDEDLRGYFPQLQPDAALAQLRVHNPQATWLYTRGAAGAVLLTADQTLQAPAPPTRLVDTVGAGDASLAGLLLALHQRQPPAQQLAYALANAALACEATGAAAPTLAQLLQRLGR